MKNIIFILLMIFSVSSFLFAQNTSKEFLSIDHDSSLMDIDGNIYKVIRINDKYWLAENFKGVKDSFGNFVQGIYSYQDDTSLVPKFGRLYTWPAAIKLAPKGWRLPTNLDWEELITYCGGKLKAGGALKAKGTEHWDPPNTGAIDSINFKALPAGFRGSDGIYYDLRKHSDFWGITNNTQDPFSVYLYYYTSALQTDSTPDDKTSGIAFSVRYIKK